MSTLDLGKIKLVWKGAYNNGTAYTPDDVVSSGGSSYICIAASTGNAVSNGTYWNLLAQGGTDVGTTLTAQGDILYRDGSGLQRLGAGTSGKVLTTKGSGQNPTWETAVGGKILQAVVATDSTQRITNSTSYTTSSNTLSVQITPSASSSKILINSSFTYYHANWSNWSNYTIYKDGSNVKTGGLASAYNGGHDAGGTIFMSYYDGGGDTNAHTYNVYFKKSGSGDIYINANSGMLGQIIAYEIAA